MKILILVFLVLLIHAVFPLPLTDREPVISAGDLGKIQGLVSRSRNTGREFLQFYGIPYALPPVAEKRFMVRRIHFTQNYVR